MQRSYDPSSLVTLPRLDAANAVTLVTALLTASKAVKKLPPSIASALAKVSAALVPLQKGLLDRLSTPLVDPVAATAADRQEDTAWSALHDWLQGWSKLPGAHNKAATALYQMLFPDGLKFILFEYTQEWAEVEARMQKLHAGGHEKTLTELGGAPFLAVMRSAHKHYGEVLGITSVKGAPAATPSVADPLLALTKALKTYVLKVTAHADEDDASSITLVEQLLRPLTTWASSATAAKPQKTPATSTPGTKTPAIDIYEVGAAGGENPIAPLDPINTKKKK